MDCEEKEICKTCLFFELCKEVKLPYCDEKDYVKEKSSI